MKPAAVRCSGGDTSTGGGGAVSTGSGAGAGGGVRGGASAQARAARREADQLRLAAQQETNELRTTAIRDGDHYVINGQKTWTTLGQYADWIFLLVRTDPENPKSQEGISFLLCDMKSPGITVRPIVNQLGEHDFNEVTFDDVAVPADALVGELLTLAEAEQCAKIVQCANPRQTVEIVECA